MGRPVISVNRSATSKLIGRRPERIRDTVGCVTLRRLASSSCVVQVARIHRCSLVRVVKGMAMVSPIIPYGMRSRGQRAKAPLDIIYARRYRGGAWTPDPGTEDKMDRKNLDDLVALAREQIEHARKTERLARERLARLEAGVRS
jgi:hypothetical protein